MAFIKKQEDFICENCGGQVKGDGYTNHCPACLWSKHVDIDPGDRASGCKGMMRPISVYILGDRISITHQCIECGHQKKNKTTAEDNIDIILAL